MRLEAWLALATAGLTPGVQARMRAEYTAHVQDAGVGEGDVQAVLGTPEEARQALGRLYLTAHDLDGLRPSRIHFLGSWLLAGYGTLLLLLWAGGNDQVGPGLTGVLVAGLVLGGLTIWTRRLAPELRALLRVQGGLWAVNLSFWLGWLTGGWTGEPPLWLVLGFPLVWVCWGAEVRFRSRKLYRTLALEQQGARP
ncbi:hypothetical protein [Deinococcus arcticus]|uniref:Uncharacterized protein n=1 Tax=Deinococcus arcticus TaxID=2136176 RepID=A0A2T3W9Y2_9DEIO|nr:hypothetical protein [Deinococcus arcticus]PTA68647.1 hypothetical protein C8263_05175 [Deinococcus arcticus]